MVYEIGGVKNYNTKKKWQSPLERKKEKGKEMGKTGETIIRAEKKKNEGERYYHRFALLEGRFVDTPFVVLGNV